MRTMPRALAAEAERAQARDFMAELGVGVLDRERVSRASRELSAIVSGTERATQSILQAAEAIDHAAGTLSAAMKNAHDKGLAHDIQDRVVQIFESCNFQDLTGQRVNHVVETLAFVEQRIGRLLEIWQRIEAAEPAFVEARDDDRRFLNGPKVADERGHSEQHDIDAMFGCA